jgi:L-threonylcarbamoyladenylate synthase
MTLYNDIAQAVTHLKKGHIIAYPTEAVYGLGCDPYNQDAVTRLYELKNRDITKGCILIAASWEQISFLIMPLSEQQLKRVTVTWPGPMTWVFPASKSAPRWLIAQDDTIALRISSHPMVVKLCEEFKNPIVSTSANPGGLPPAKTSFQVRQYFQQKIDFILEGAVGELQTPTPIRDAVTGVWYRE